MDFLSVAGEYTAERTIEKSRFLSYVAHAAGEEEARAFLDRVRREHPLSTHVCWAYIGDRLGNLQRFSDDGEPQGTAGMPILGVLKAKELRETAVAVVRYFGGIKLGAGGLTRAYQNGVKEALALLPVTEKKVFLQARARVSYAHVDRFYRLLPRFQARVTEESFGEAAVFTLELPEECLEPCRVALREATDGMSALVAGEEA